MRKTGRRVCMPGALVAGLVLAGVAHAELRIRLTDEEIVRRAELIVVGRLQEGSLRHLPRVEASGGRSWEYSAVLEIAEVLRGEAPPATLPVAFHYGTLPPAESYDRPIEVGDVMLLLIVGAYEFGEIGMRYLDPGSVPSDGLWFLRRQKGRTEVSESGDLYGVVEPESFQLSERRDYFKAYLAADPEAAVRRQLALDPSVAAGAQRYLEQREIERALALADPGARAETLADFFVRGAGQHYGAEAREGLLAIGSAAGPALRRVFDDPAFAHRRSAVIELWGRIGYREAVPALITLLEENHAFWSRQRLAPGWWNSDLGSELSQERRRRYGEVLGAIVALEKLGDAQAARALAETRRLWAGIPDVDQIVDGCDQALAALLQD